MQFARFGSILNRVIGGQKKIPLIIFLLSVISITFLMLLAGDNKQKSPPTIEWQISLGGSADDKARSIQQTKDGGYIIAGYSRSTDGNVTQNQDSADYWIVKLNANGAIEWQKSLGGSSYDEARSIQQTKDGGYIITGESWSIDGDVTGRHGAAGKAYYWIVKLNANGAIEWDKTLGGSGNDYANSVQQTKDGGYIVAGSSRSTDGDVTKRYKKADYWIVKLDANGAIEWDKTLGGSDDDEARSIQQTNDGGYIVAGYSRSTDGDVTENKSWSDYWIVKLNANGAIEWQKSLGGSAGNYANSIQQTNDGGYIVAGYSRSTDGNVTGRHDAASDNLDYWIVKLDANGAIEWDKTLGGSADDCATSIKQTNDGGYIIAGSSESNDGDVTENKGWSDYWIVKLDANGAIEWDKTLGGSDIDWIYSIQQTRDGGYIIAGYSHSIDGDVIGHHGSTKNSDYWIIKLK
ncbi:MAG: hypothetical protein LBF86_00580 [Helicobacteraceae bacterium]|jgi:sarcosine oxidase delta subunit|nr:hypothetical protein [Helicobacteraceae bacterium]